jgi:hypothetical protein
LFFKCILEVVFCEDIQHRLWFCLDHLISLENGGLLVFSYIGKIKLPPFFASNTSFV